MSQIDTDAPVMYSIL